MQFGCEFMLVTVWIEPDEFMLRGDLQRMINYIQIYRRLLILVQ